MGGKRFNLVNAWYLHAAFQEATPAHNYLIDLLFFLCTWVSPYSFSLKAWYQILFGGYSVGTLRSMGNLLPCSSDLAASYNFGFNSLSRFIALLMLLYCNFSCSLRFARSSAWYVDQQRCIVSCLIKSSLESFNSLGCFLLADNTLSWVMTLWARGGRPPLLFVLLPLVKMTENWPILGFFAGAAPRAHLLIRSMFDISVRPSRLPDELSNICLIWRSSMVSKSVNVACWIWKNVIIMQNGWNVTTNAIIKPSIQGTWKYMPHLSNDLHLMPSSILGRTYS